MANTPAPKKDEAEKKIEAEPIAPGESQADADKVTVSTTGDFMIMDPYTLDIVEASGKSEVRNTTFIQNKIKEGQLKKA